MPGHNIIVIGTSAGGLDALRQVVKELPRDLPAAVFIVQHVLRHTPSILPTLLTRAGVLPAEHPVNGQPFERGHIYVAPPGAHLLIERERIRLAAGPRENRHCPAIDPLFRTAALAYGPRVIGVVLTGALNDGTAGLRAIKQRGGLAVVQDPAEAFNASMPESALAYVAVDACLPLAEIPRYLVRMTREPAPPEQDFPVAKTLRVEANIDGLAPDTHLEGDEVGIRSDYTCPECKGPLREIHDGKLLRFRCRVGHAYTGDALVDSQADAVDAALWTALETLEQRAEIAGKLASRARADGHELSATSFDAQGSDMARKIRTLRDVLLVDGLRDAPTEARSHEAEAQASEAEQSKTPA